MNRWLLALLGLVLFAGCAQNRTETGYEARALNDDLDAQRLYYAQPFSPSAIEAAAARQEQFQRRRPDIAPR